MATATVPQPSRPVPATYWASPSIYRFSVGQYDRMVEAGILSKYDKVELLEGYVVLKMSKGPPHDGTIDVAGDALRAVLPAGWRLRTQQAVDLVESKPEPDFSVVRGGSRSFLTRHPGIVDIGLVVEVVDSSLAQDQVDMGRIYARAGLPVYWIINLVDTQVEVYTRPPGPADAPAYGALDTYAPGDDVPLVLDGVTVATVPAADLLP